METLEIEENDILSLRKNNKNKSGFLVENREDEKKTAYYFLNGKGERGMGRE